jgi:hypothetical protein
MSTTSGSPVAETWSVYRLRMGELAAGCGMYDKAHAEIRQRMTPNFGVGGVVTVRGLYPIVKKIKHIS